LSATNCKSLPKRMHIYASKNYTVSLKSQALTLETRDRPIVHTQVGGPPRDYSSTTGFQFFYFLVFRLDFMIKN